MSNQSAGRTLKKADVLTVADIPHQTFQHWTDRRLIKLSGDDVPGNGRGMPRRFGMRRVAQIAIAHKISKLGIPANVAVTLAAKFTDEPQRGRPVGGLFPQGRTMIVASDDGTSRVVNIEPDDDVDSELVAEASLIIDVGSILSNIYSRLDNLN